MLRGALDDIKVLDLGSMVAAPYCAKLLADYGADVIKIEAPDRGDPARSVGPFPGDESHPEKSGLFLHLNANKKGITLNLQCRDGAKLLKELVRQADILLENFHPSVLPSLGLAYSELEAVNPQLVMTSITPFGSTGPYRDHSAEEMGVFAMSGRMYIHGLPEREPLRYAPETAWFQVGSTAAVSTMAAYLASRAQGVGQQVDVSAMEALTGNVDNRPLFYAYSGSKSQRGTWPGGFPQGAYPCQDGYVVFGVGYNRFFGRLCEAMGMPELSEDPRFTTPQGRQEHRAEFDELFLGWTMERTKREIFQVCQDARVLCAPLLDPGELMEDPQLVEREYFVELEHAQAGKLTYPGPPFKLSEAPSNVHRPAPLLGEHNMDVFCGRLGYSRQDLSRLRAVGAI